MRRRLQLSAQIEARSGAFQTRSYMNRDRAEFDYPSGSVSNGADPTLKTRSCSLGRHFLRRLRPPPLSLQPLAGTLQVEIDHGRRVESQRLRHDEAADDRDAER